MPITASDFQIWQTGGQQITVGPAGPSAVSKDANNKATLGSDSLILVQGTAAGIAATTHAQTVSGDDPQLTNARTPTPHQATHNGGSDAIPLASAAAQGLCPPVDNTTIQVSGGKLVAVGGGSAGVSTDANNKATLGSDSKILVQGTAAGIAASTHAQTVSGDDPQLTNARTPTAHGGTHTTTDLIPLASTTAQGALRQVSGNTTDFIDGTNNSQPLQPVIWSARLRSFNAIGNPTFEIDQRNVGNAVTNPSALAIDRWASGKNGTMSYTAQQMVGNVLFPGTNFILTQNFLRITLTVGEASLAAGDYLVVQQNIEGPRLRELIGDVHSKQLLIRSSVAGLQFGLGLRGGTTTPQYLTKLSPTGLVANNWTMVQFPNIPVWPSAAGFVLSPGNLGYTLTLTLACGSTYTSAANNVWQSGNLFGAVGQSNFAASPVNSTFDIGFIQHEPGPLCTTPIDCPFENNLDSCLRYYAKSLSYNVKAGSATNSAVLAGLIVNGQNYSRSAVLFPKRMAKIPTCTAYHYDGTANSCFVDNGGGKLTVSSIQNYDSLIYQINTASTVSLTASPAPLCCDWTADTGW